MSPQGSQAGGLGNGSQGLGAFMSYHWALSSLGQGSRQLGHRRLVLQLAQDIADLMTEEGAAAVQACGREGAERSLAGQYHQGK